MQHNLPCLNLLTLKRGEIFSEYKLLRRTVSKDHALCRIKILREIFFWDYDNVKTFVCRNMDFHGIKMLCHLTKLLSTGVLFKNVSYQIKNNLLSSFSTGSNITLSCSSSVPWFFCLWNSPRKLFL